MIKIRVGYELIYDLPQPTPMIMVLGTHFSRASDLLVPDYLTTTRPFRSRGIATCSATGAAESSRPPGRLRLYGDGSCATSGQPDIVAPDAPQHAVEDLPPDTLVFLLGSRYCETDRLSDQAWQLFGNTPPGWARVQAICDFVHHHITFGYQHARPTKTAWEAFNERNGVCRDYAHLAITFCRA